MKKKSMLMFSLLGFLAFTPISCGNNNESSNENYDESYTEKEDPEQINQSYGVVANVRKITDRSAIISCRYNRDKVKIESLTLRRFNKLLPTDGVFYLENLEPSTIYIYTISCSSIDGLQHFMLKDYFQTLPKKVDKCSITPSFDRFNFDITYADYDVCDVKIKVKDTNNNDVNFKYSRSTNEVYNLKPGTNYNVEFEITKKNKNGEVLKETIKKTIKTRSYEDHIDVSIVSNYPDCFRYGLVSKYNLKSALVINPKDEGETYDVTKNSDDSIELKPSTKYILKLNLELGENETFYQTKEFVTSENYFFEAPRSVIFAKNNKITILPGKRKNYNLVDISIYKDGKYLEVCDNNQGSNFFEFDNLNNEEAYDIEVSYSYTGVDYKKKKFVYKETVIIRGDEDYETSININDLSSKENSIFYDIEFKNFGLKNKEFDHLELIIKDTKEIAKTTKELKGTFDNLEVGDYLLNIYYKVVGEVLPSEERIECLTKEIYVSGFTANEELIVDKNNSVTDSSFTFEFKGVENEKLVRNKIVLTKKGNFSSDHYSLKYNSNKYTIGSLDANSEYTLEIKGCDQRDFEQSLVTTFKTAPTAPYPIVDNFSVEGRTINYSFKFYFYEGYTITKSVSLMHGDEVLLSGLPNVGSYAITDPKYYSCDSLLLEYSCVSDVTTYKPKGTLKHRVQLDVASFIKEDDLKRRV